MARFEAAKKSRDKKQGLGLAVLLLLALALSACGAEPAVTQTPPTLTPAVQSTPARTPAPIKTITPAPTATSDVARVFDSPAPTPPPIFPTSTPAPTLKGPNFT